MRSGPSVGKHQAEDNLGSTERIRKKLRTSSAAVPLPLSNSPPSFKYFASLSPFDSQKKKKKVTFSTPIPITTQKFNKFDVNLLGFLDIASINNLKHETPRKKRVSISTLLHLVISSLVLFSLANRRSSIGGNVSTAILVLKLAHITP